jgi:hypothetical protein
MLDSTMPVRSEATPDKRTSLAGPSSGPHWRGTGPRFLSRMCVAGGYGMVTPVGSGAEASLTSTLVTTVSPEVTEVWLRL